MADYDLSDLSVLVVERHAYMRRILSDILHEFHVGVVHEAANASAGFSLQQEEPSDVVITDWSPGVDGLTLVRALRRHPKTPDPYVPIIVVSAHTELARVCEARDAGMTEFLAKPISAKLIYFRIRSMIEHHRLFVRGTQFFGPDRRRRRAVFPGAERRHHGNISGDERRRAQVELSGPERRQGFAGYVPPEDREHRRAA